MKKMYIDGCWVGHDAQDCTVVINPADGQIIDTVPCATLAYVKNAIGAARTAFLPGSEWRSLAPGDRSRILHKIADLIEERTEEIARIETTNQGKTLFDSTFDVELGAGFFRSMASMIGALGGQTFDFSPSLHAMTIREPLGVCAIIVPWNYPFYIMTQYASIALAAGNTIICRPSEITPMSAIALFEIFEEAGLPKGVANLILGKSSVIGEALTRSNDIDKVSFIGSTDVGREVMKASAESNFKHLALELGGKSPSIVFDDADLDNAIDHAGLAAFMNSGQTCTAGSRLLLQENIYDTFMDKFLKGVKNLRIGAGLDDNVQIGPMVSEAHMNRVLRYIETGLKEGGTLACGGRRAMDGGLKNGFFIEPTVFTNVTNDMTIVQEEIFGPVLTVQKFKTEEEAVELANSTKYGLAAGIFTSDGTRAIKMARAIDCGTIYVNNYFAAVNEAPSSALKESGIAQEMGVLGLEGYTKIKQINISVEMHPAGLFNFD